MARFRRPIGTRSPNKVIYIYTEGSKTEPNYFNSIKKEIRVSGIQIKIEGKGFNTQSLVDRVLKKKEESGGEDCEWWVVFDRDSHEGFDNAISSAQANGINVAYSNEAFELWFILHFHLLESALDRSQCSEKLSQLLGQRYDKTMDVYSLIKDKEAVALRNAKRCERLHDNSIPHSQRNPYTSVYKLVERLRSLKRG